MRIWHYTKHSIRRVRSSPISVVSVACIALLIDNLCYSISFACIPHIFQDMAQQSESKIGLSAAMFGVGSVLTSIVSGTLSDRFRSRKALMAVGALGYVASGVVLHFSTKIWHVLVYRLVNGLGSGFLYPIAMSTTGDVYPSELLGLKMALLNSLNNVGYMIGPVLGGILYDKLGVHGVSSVIVGVGTFLVVLILVGTREPLVLHDEIMLSYQSLALTERKALINGSGSDTEDFDMTLTERMLRTDSSAPQPSVLQRTETPAAATMPLWRLLMRWQMLSASIITLSVGMLFGSLESLLPMHLKDHYNMSASKSGILFVINGFGAIVLSTPVGWAVDRLIAKYGEAMRMHIELAGLLLTFGSVLMLGLSRSYPAILAADAWFAAGMLLVNIPVMSTFGDLVNSLNINSMAQSYGVYNSFWSLASTIAPPIVTLMYSNVGYRMTVSGFLVGLCVLCTAIVAVDPARRACAHVRRLL